MFKKVRMTISVLLIIATLFSITVCANAAYAVGSTAVFPWSTYATNGSHGTSADVSNSLTWARNTSQTLFVSNNPEQIESQGILYQDSNINTTGKFRVYWAHKYSIWSQTNSGGYIGFVLYNNTGKTIKVNFGKAGYGVSATPIEAGRVAYTNWLQRSETETTYATVQNGGYTYVSFPTDNGSTCIGMYDVVIRDTAGSLVTGGITVKTFVTYKATATGVAEYLAGLTGSEGLLAKSGGETRGTIQYAKKNLTWANAAKNKCISFTATVSHPSWNQIPNELDSYTSRFDNVSSAIHYGSYGMDLNINVTFAENNSALALVPCYLGNDQNYPAINHPMVAKVNGTVMSKTVPNGNMWIIATGNAGTTVNVQTSLVSFDYAPMRLVVLPNT